LLGALAVLVVCSGCGVVAAGGPNAIPKGQVPFHLLTKVVPTTTSTTAPVATAAVNVYFVGQTHQYLVPATRAVPAPPTLHTLLEELLAGPTTAEHTAGVRSAISDSVRLLSVKPAVVKPSTDVVTVDLNTSFGLISGTQEVLAVAQVVFTVTSQVGREIGVQFQIDGVTTDVPTATGGEVAKPVSYRQYATLTTPKTTTTTTSPVAAPGL
jgi:spore germination protein GerM